MRNTDQLKRAALVSAIALCFVAPTVAAQSSSGSNSMQTPNPTSKHGTSAGTTSPSEAGVLGDKSNSGAAPMTPPTSTARGTADNTNSKTGPTANPDGWATTHAGQNQGRVSRQAYMDEMGRRYDSMDKAKQAGTTRQAYLDDLGQKWKTMDRDDKGLTPAEVSRITGKVDVSNSALPRTGSDVQAGNMGPTNSKAQ